jgi:DNA-directed RNA polymerase specialized sigma24 family protein
MSSVFILSSHTKGNDCRTSKISMQTTPKESAFIQMFETHADDFFRDSLAYVGDRARAFELTQEAFIHAWDKVRDGAVPELSAIRHSLRDLLQSELRFHEAIS